jgi:hypothetical protein
LLIFGFGFLNTGLLTTAETSGTSPDSGVASRIKTISDALAAKSPSFGSTDQIPGVGDWGTMWDRIYTASTWNPTATAVVGDVTLNKTFYAGENRVKQTGQGTQQNAPAAVTPAPGDASRINSLYKALKTISYGSESGVGTTWGDWGAMWNRIYSASIWTPSDADAVPADVVSGKTFYAGNNRTIQTGTLILPSANLTNIALTGSPTNYTFAGGTYTYNSVGVANAVSSITVTPTGAGVITVEGTIVSSGQASGSIALTAGVEKTITVIATESGKSAKTYVIKVTRTAGPTIGSSYQGGVIAFIDGTGIHGLLAAPSDQSRNATWAAAGTLCTNLSLGGYGGYYIPSRTELATLFTNRVAIGGFSDQYEYWTSVDCGGSGAYYKSFYLWSGTEACQQKTNGIAIRCVRTY